jgi:hypothetical protein
MKLFTRRTLTMATLAVVAAVTAGIVAVVRSGSSNASPVRQAVPLAQTDLRPAAKAAVADAARDNGVNPANVVELGGSGAGAQRHGVLVGRNTSGVSVLSFLTGFGMSEFVPGARYANIDHPMFVTSSVQGPSTESRIVGIVGIATRAIERVTVQLANDTTVTLPVSQAPSIQFEGFSYVSESAATFPVKVTGYNAGGKVVAEHEVDAKPLCKAEQPDCFN